MCRLVAYLGHDVLLEDILVKPMNSIVMQSLHARETTIPTNGDGFGIGWYVPSISPIPALFTSISPAWSDRNLLNLTAKIKSNAFFAHVRAASFGGVTHYNCHPFVFKEWMLMHNGGIANFINIKRHLRHLLDDDMYHWVKGDTDSEHLLALIFQLAKNRDLSQLETVADVLEEAFSTIANLLDRYGQTDEPSYFNLCLTDGKRLLVSRYVRPKHKIALSLHYALGSRFVIKHGHYHMLQEAGEKNCLLVASEKLTRFNAEWHDIPHNKLMLVDIDKRLSYRPL